MTTPITPASAAGALPPVEAAPRRRASGPRVETVDLLRGLIMVLMVLDHTRDFVHAPAFALDPTDPATTTVPIFLTRWITHLCAPAFVFLAGTGAYLQLLRGKSRGELSRFLLTRGAWLVVLEFTVVHLAIGFRIDPTFVGMASVFWMIGVSMMVLAALVWLPIPAIGAFGVLMIVVHNAFDGFRPPAWGGPGTPAPTAVTWLWTVLHRPGLLPLASDGTPMVFVGYPLIPWIGVIAAGYAFGSVYRLPAARRPARIAAIGAVLVVAFLALRTLNVYGEPMQWSAQSSAVLTVLSFLRLSKYPPSLLFLCATLGIDLLLLAWFERRRLRGPATALERVFVTFGQVPLFFYMLQWVVTHGGALAAMVLAGQDYTRLLYHPIMAPPAPPGTGFSLPVVYGLWLLGIVVLYFPCRWYAGVKARRRDWWLSYL